MEPRGSLLLSSKQFCGFGQKCPRGRLVVPLDRPPLVDNPDITVLLATIIPVGIILIIVIVLVLCKYRAKFCHNNDDGTDEATDTDTRDCVEDTGGNCHILEDTQHDGNALPDIHNFDNGAYDPQGNVNVGFAVDNEIDFPIEGNNDGGDGNDDNCGTFENLEYDNGAGSGTHNFFNGANGLQGSMNDVNESEIDIDGSDFSSTDSSGSA